jgi:hypothetical protein
MGLTIYKTDSEKLSWMNSVIHLSDFTYDPSTQESISVFYE